MIYVLPVDEWGCGYYRLIWPVQILKHMGLNIKIIKPSRHKFFIKNNKIMVPPDAELIVIQRPATVFHVKLIEALQRAGIAVVVDMDDDITSVDPTNFAFQFYRHRPDKFHSWKYTVDACRSATLLTVSTPTLLDVYNVRERGMVLNNYVPAAYLRIKAPQISSFGWAGNTLSHYSDLNVMTPAVQRLIDENYEFRVVGGDAKTQAALRLRDRPFMTGDVAITSWAQMISEHIGIGLAPLAATKFNASKSRLKCIEYMAVGVPWVASPRTEYRQLQRDAGCGLLADTPTMWYTWVKRLLTDDQLYAEQVEAGCTFMQSQTYELNAWRWAEAWDRAIELQRGRMT